MTVITDINQLDFEKNYTYADYLHWAFKERIELLKGKVLQMSPAPSTKHQRVSMKFTGKLLRALEDKPCQLFAAPFDVRLAHKNDRDEDIITVVQPDLCVICDMDKLDDRGCIGAPDLIIEILSPGNSKKEMNAKFDLYEEAGVREYWLVHPLDEVVFVYVLQDGQYQALPAKPIVDNYIPSQIFPELKIHTDEVFNS